MQARKSDKKSTWFSKGTLGDKWPQSQTVSVVAHELLDTLSKLATKNANTGLNALTPMWDGGMNKQHLSVTGCMPVHQAVKFFFSNINSGMSGRMFLILAGDSTADIFFDGNNWTWWINTVRLILRWCEVAVDNGCRTDLQLAMSARKISERQHIRSCILFLVYAQLSNQNILDTMEADETPFEMLPIGSSGATALKDDLKEFTILFGSKNYSEIEHEIHIRQYSTVIDVLKLIKAADTMTGAANGKSFLNYLSTQQTHGAAICRFELQPKVLSTITQFNDDSPFYNVSDASSVQNNISAGDVWMDQRTRIQIKTKTGGSAAKALTKICQKTQKTAATLELTERALGITYGETRELSAAQIKVLADDNPLPSNIEIKLESMQFAILMGDVGVHSIQTLQDGIHYAGININPGESSGSVSNNNKNKIGGNSNSNNNRNTNDKDESKQDDKKDVEYTWIFLNALLQADAGTTDSLKPVEDDGVYDGFFRIRDLYREDKALRSAQRYGDMKAVDFEYHINKLEQMKMIEYYNTKVGTSRNKQKIVGLDKTNTLCLNHLKETCNNELHDTFEWFSKNPTKLNLLIARNILARNASCSNCPKENEKDASMSASGSIHIMSGSNVNATNENAPNNANNVNSGDEIMSSSNVNPTDQNAHGENDNSDNTNSINSGEELITQNAGQNHADNESEHPRKRRRMNSIQPPSNVNNQNSSDASTIQNNGPIHADDDVKSDENVMQPIWAFEDKLKDWMRRFNVPFQLKVRIQEYPARTPYSHKISHVVILRRDNDCMFNVFKCILKMFDKNTDAPRRKIYDLYMEKASSDMKTNVTHQLIDKNQEASDILQEGVYDHPICDVMWNLITKCMGIDIVIYKHDDLSIDVPSHRYLIGEQFDRGQETGLQPRKFVFIMKESLHYHFLVSQKGRAKLLKFCQEQRESKEAEYNLPGSSKTVEDDEWKLLTVLKYTHFLQKKKTQIQNDMAYAASF